MSDKLFRTNDLVKFDYSEIGEYVDENHTDTPLRNDEVCKILNEQQSNINQLKEENEQLRKYNGQLKERLEKINGGYGYLTHRNGLTANEWVIESQERELKKKNEQISDWIEQHSKDIVKIGEQQYMIKSKDKQLERLYNYFQDYLKDEMSGNAFSEMWDFVKEDESWEDG